jgi:hypothetical protein
MTGSIPLNSRITESRGVLPTRRAPVGAVRDLQLIGGESLGRRTAEDHFRSRLT